MPRIDLVEPYAIRQTRQAIRDAFMSHGEECILMHMWHVNEATPDTPRCSACYDDIYKQSGKFDCGYCYGTTYEGGVKEYYRAWAIFTDSHDREDFTKRGFWHPQPRSVQTEWQPDLWQNDYIIRVPKWTTDHRPVEIDSIYVLKEVQNDSIRTGNAFGQTTMDAISQRGDVERVAEQLPIYKFPVIGRVFNRADGKAR